MFTLFVRAIILYILIVLLLRGMGKHQQGQFQPYELAIALIMANLLATPMNDVATPLMHGVLPVAALYIVHGIITLFTMKSDKFRAIVSGKPSIIVSRGVINHKELRRLCLSLSDFLEGARESGILDPAEVGTAVVEADGHISAFPHVRHRPISVGDMHLDPGYEGMPLTVVSEGRIQPYNLGVTRQDEVWLTELLGRYNLPVRNVLIASIDTKGRMHVQDMNSALLSIQALTPEQVVW